MVALLLALTLGSSVVEEDARRIQQHLLETEAALRANPPAGLTEAQRAARARNLEHLHAYAVRRVYPINHTERAYTPIFIDGYGTRCAMAALIEQEGGAAFVERIARTRNLDRVHQLADEPELHAWLEANGLTVEEAARIQPGYTRCGVTRAQAICQGGAPAARVRIVASDSNGNVTVKAERSVRNAPWKEGDVKTLAKSLDFGAMQNEIVADRALWVPFATTGEPVVYRMAFISANGGVHAPGDRGCNPRRAVSLAEAERLGELPVANCEAELKKLDPAWTAAACVENLDEKSAHLTDFNECRNQRSSYTPEIYGTDPKPFVDPMPKQGCAVSSPDALLAAVALLGLLRRRVQRREGMR